MPIAENELAGHTVDKNTATHIKQPPYDSKIFESVHHFRIEPERPIRIRIRIESGSFARVAL